LDVEVDFWRGRETPLVRAGIVEATASVGNRGNSVEIKLRITD
jgi:hypothetical protein